MVYRRKEKCLEVFSHQVLRHTFVSSQARRSTGTSSQVVFGRSLYDNSRGLVRPRCCKLQWKATQQATGSIFQKCIQINHQSAKCAQQIHPPNVYDVLRWERASISACEILGIRQWWVDGAWVRVYSTSCFCPIRSSKKCYATNVFPVTKAFFIQESDPEKRVRVRLILKEYRKARSSFLTGHGHR